MNFDDVVGMAFRCRVFMSSLLLGVVCLLPIKGNCLSSLSLQSFMRDDTPILYVYSLYKCFYVCWI